MKSYLTGLLERLNDSSYKEGAAVIENEWSSDKTVASAVRDEIFNLQRDELIPVLIEMFNEESNPEQQRDILFILCSITGKTANRQAQDFIYATFSTTENDSITRQCLGFYSSYYFLEDRYDIQPLLRLLEYGTQDMLSSVYKAIGKSAYPGKEDILLQEAAGLSNAYDIECMVIVLGQYGTEKSLPFLDAGLKSKSSRVRTFSQITRSRILAR